MVQLVIVCHSRPIYLLQSSEVGDVQGYRPVENKDYVKGGGVFHQSTALLTDDCHTKARNVKC